MLHGRELVEDLLFTDAEAAMRLSLTLYVLELDRVIKAALVEVRSRFIIVHLLVHLRHFKEDFETFACRRIAIESFTGLEVLHDTY